jgi:hypothetical protein
MKNRFDPTPDGDFAKCQDCGETLALRQFADDHLKETREAAANKHSHTILILNPSRQSRIETAVSHIIEDAIQEGLEEVDRLIADEEITEEEATKALLFYDGFYDEWIENWAGTER